MTDLLSMPKRTKTNLYLIKGVKFKSGLPINSLPGWEHIPLNSKLPMLKCPGNQVIFSKNKIGQSLKPLKQEFDSSVRESLPEYNALHDSNLKTFYSNERNLKRLRENGEITITNDVICNLKDFNEYREQLHRSQLYYILTALNRMEIEQRDRTLVSNAEHITCNDHLGVRHHSQTEIISRRNKQDMQKVQHKLKILQKTHEKFERIAGVNEMKRVLLEHKKILNQLQMQRHVETCNDLQRKHMISLKKLFQFKKDRFYKNLRAIKLERYRKAAEAQMISWEKRMAERIANQVRMSNLLEEVAIVRQGFIQKHAERYRVKWDKIQRQIKKRSEKNRMKHRALLTPDKKVKRVSAPVVDKTESKELIEKSQTERVSLCSSNKEQSLEYLLDTELCEILKASVDMENIPFESDDPIYKAATFVLQHIISKYEKDLSTDLTILECVRSRIKNFFNEAKHFVIFKSSQIITAIRKSKELKVYNSSVHNNNDGARRSSVKNVKFGCISNTIGTSSYAIHPFVDIRRTSDRMPTPKGSLDSLIVNSEETLLKKLPSFHSMCRNDLIFVEHYIIQFKRQLIVGIGKRVFAAINAHYEDKIMHVRKELLDVDRNYLVTQAAKSILSYAINPCNFHSCLKFCISVMATEIIWALQKNLLRPSQKIPPNMHLNEGMRVCTYCPDCSRKDII